MAENEAYKTMAEFYDRLNKSTVSEVENLISDIDSAAMAEK